MSLLVSWIGLDEKKDGKEIASIYLASDSRYTWGNSKKFDYGIKVWGSTKHPEIFGFCGDVLFPSIIFAQIISQIDNGLLFDISDNAETKNNKVFSYIQASFNNYPKSIMAEGFTILHTTRFEKSFRLFKISCDDGKQLKKEEVALMEKEKISRVVFNGGSGGAEFDENWTQQWIKKHNNYGTSRAVYHCICKTLKEIKDTMTGGKPQLVGLYRNENSKLFGIIENREKYIYGKECLEDTCSTNIEWRNENFERMNPETLRILEGAQRQPS